MLLSSRMLLDVASVNSFEPSSFLQWTEGDVLTIYLQLVDISIDRAEQGYNPPGRRYIPANGATLQVQIQNIDDSKVVTRLASQPFAGDGSIWALPIFATDKLRGSPQMLLTLTEGAVVTRGVVKCSLKVFPQGNL